MLKVGDIVKFGRVPFIVKESSLQQSKGTLSNLLDQNYDMETLDRQPSDSVCNDFDE